MKKKIIISIITLSHSALLLLMLALGSQNLSSVQRVNFGFSQSQEAYPVGFLIGISTIIGSISGSLTTVLLLPSSTKNLS